MYAMAALRVWVVGSHSFNNRGLRLGSSPSISAKGSTLTSEYGIKVQTRESFRQAFYTEQHG